MNKNQYKTLTETLIKEVDELNAAKRSSRRVIKSCDEMNKAYLDRNRFLEEKIEELEADSKDLIVANKLLQEQLKSEKKKHVKTADEISQWCRWYGDCGTCNHMQMDDEGDGGCDLEIYGYQPYCWSSHVIATLDRIMTFESPTDTVVEDTEDDK